MTHHDPDAAPGLVPDVTGQPWWRRAVAQGAGYTAPSSLFFLIPIWFMLDSPAPRLLATVIAAAVGAVFYLGGTVVMHWVEWARWLWLLGLMLAILGMDLASAGAARSHYFVVFVTVAASMLIRWRDARILITMLSLLATGFSLLHGDLFGVIMASMALTLGLSLGFSLVNERTRQELAAERERTAVLAVAAERERIARDLHDILGHSLTLIAVKADLAHRLVGRDDAAAVDEIGSLANIARRALADVRATASGMREVRLASEIASARSVLLASGLEAITPSALPEFGDAEAEALGYVVREAVTNVVRHAKATVCEITVGAGVVSVRDDGQGGADESAGSGLVGLKKRLERMGGRLAIVSGRSGTLLTASLPGGDRGATAPGGMP